MDIQELKKHLLEEAKNLLDDLTDYNLQAIEHVNLDWSENDIKEYNSYTEKRIDRLSDISLICGNINKELKKKNA